MSKRLYTLEVSIYDHVVSAIACGSLWVMSLMFSYGILTQNISGREFYMLLAGLLLFYGMAIFTSYTTIKQALHRVTRLNLTSDELQVRYKDGKEDIYPLALYTFLLFEACSPAIGAGADYDNYNQSSQCMLLTITLSVNTDIDKDKNSEEVYISNTQEEEMNILYEKIIAAQKAL
ncbi:hypothetical protein [Desulfovibrio litoralis]|uniref:Uncharacterized protein n=1 Tax=Desulfovibrio litoralis DSM 11393 TaxID=1121455 RepID=A0A1M7SGL1_9BACT|nr:hypothetical protein [Desulfovibrio litoralis]SHN57619.1 hypothetical protein SAMN02745728_00927 [Desulfovibrio litoralis DSM 11393]